MRINWEVVKPSLWTGAGGVVVGMLLLSYGFGFMSRTTAEKLATQILKGRSSPRWRPPAQTSSVHCRMLRHEQRPS